MKKDFKQELTELINKHGLEKEMRDTPDYILAEICIDAMAVFSEAIARRDEWHGFRKADEKNAKDAKRNYPEDCNICITENCPFKKGDRIKYNGKPGKIEVIKAEHNGNFSYEVRFDKKDGTPSVRVTSFYPLLKIDKMEKE